MSQLPSDSDEFSQRKKRPPAETLQRYGVVLLLLIVASHQFYRVHAEGLSSWRGGGFGMYGGYHPKQNDLWWIDLESGESTRYTKKKGVATEDDRYPSLRPYLTYVNETSLKRHLNSLPANVRERTRVEVWQLDFDPETKILGRRLLISAGPDKAPATEQTAQRQEGDTP